MDTALLAIIILAILGLATAYIIKEKKKGTKCIGCPAAGQCTKCCTKNNNPEKGA